LGATATCMSARMTTGKSAATTARPGRALHDRVSCPRDSVLGHLRGDVHRDHAAAPSSRRIPVLHDSKVEKLAEPGPSSMKVRPPCPSPAPSCSSALASPACSPASPGNESGRVRPERNKPRCATVCRGRHYCGEHEFTFLILQSEAREGRPVAALRPESKPCAHLAAQPEVGDELRPGQGQEVQVSV
jgi:hypothetical protein